MTGIEVGAIAGTAITVGDIALVAGGALTAMSAIQQGNAQKAAANYEAQVANNRAVAARQNAAAQVKRQEREARLRAGANRARVGGSGGQLLGSALDVMEDNAMEEELDRLTILHQGELQASGFQADAVLAKAEGRAAQRAGFGKAAGTLLESGAKFGSKFGGSTTSSAGPKAGLGGSNTWGYSPRYTGATADAWTK